MNWKYGGRLIEGLFTYEINIKRSRRPPLIQKPYGKCKGTWKPFELSSKYKLKGTSEPINTCSLSVKLTRCRRRLEQP